MLILVRGFWPLQLHTTPLVVLKILSLFDWSHIVFIDQSTTPTHSFRIQSVVKIQNENNQLRQMMNEGVK